MQRLLPYLQQADRPTLWFADENALPALLQLPDCDCLGDCKHLWIATNRYDIYQQAQAKGYPVEFNDFTLAHCVQTPARILYRVSKEKALTHHLFNQAAKYLANGGELVISGKKQEGIKSYGDKLKKTLQATGSLKKSANDYSGVFKNLSATTLLNDQGYAKQQRIDTENDQCRYFFSKPGVFGWDKVDQGSALLLQTLPQALAQTPLKSPLASLLDLGCGYGWIFLNAQHVLGPEWINKHTHIVATDNNAAALTCAQRNASAHDLAADVIPSDCANTLMERFELIVCNPPFHQGFAHDKSLTDKFLQQSSAHLTDNGAAVFVVNDFIGIETMAAAYFTNVTILAKAQGFKVILLQKH